MEKYYLLFTAQIPAYKREWYIDFGYCKMPIYSVLLGGNNELL